jgi:electron transport complex protein RnfG
MIMAKKAQSSLINMLLSLTVIAVVAAAALAFVSHVTAEPIAQAQKAKKEAAVKAVLPAFDRLEEAVVDGTACTKAYGADGNLVGMAIEASTEKGFGGHLGAMVGFDAEGNILGYEILEHQETPGLGSHMEHWFKNADKPNQNIIGRKAGQLTVSKDGGDVDAITAATISSRAFLKAVNQAYAEHFGVEAHTGASQLHKEAKTEEVVIIEETEVSNE